MKIAGVLFDFDGVLGNSLPLHRRAWEQAYGEIFHQEFPLVSKELLTGASPEEIAFNLAKFSGQLDFSSKLAEVKLTILLEFLEGEKRVLFPGVQGLFQALTEGGIPFGVVSNSPEVFIRRIFETAQMTSPLVVTPTTGMRPKPHPDLYLQGAKLLNLSKTQWPDILVVEDSSTGLAAAKAAGMIPLGVTTHLTPEELHSAGACGVIHSLEELKKLMQTPESWIL